MLKSWMKTALRNLLRNKIYSAINILGLAIGVACCFLILMYVQNELGYDRFHDKSDRIYRLYEQWQRAGGSSWTRSITAAAPGWRLKEDFPEIESVVRIIDSRVLVSAGDKIIYEDRVYFADEDFFNLFSFRLLKGDTATVLKAPYSVALSESMAAKYFGDDNPVGEIIFFDNTTSMTVTGVFSDVPDQSHLKFDFIASLSTITSKYPGFNDNWQNGARTYVLLKEKIDPDKWGDRLSAFVKKYRDEKTAAELSYGLQPLKDIHLNPTSVDLEATISKNRLYLFGAIAAFILLIAIVNFTNLSTAQFSRRAGEVSVRKVLGAGRKQIRQQFIGESMILVLFSVALSVVVAELLLPTFNSVAQTQLETHYVTNPLAIVGLIALTLLVGVLGGVYPAFALSRFTPVDVLRGTMTSGNRGVFMRRLLVVFQFVISVGLILSTIVVYSQFRLLSTKDLGFDTSRLIVVPIEQKASALGKVRAIKEELTRQSNVVAVAGSTYGKDYGLSLKAPEGDDEITMVVIYADHDFVRTLGLKMSDGRDFSVDRGDDERIGMIVNQRARAAYGEMFGVGNDVLMLQSTSGQPRKVVGVVENFHFRSITSFAMQPMALLINPDRIENLLIRIDGDNPSATIASIRDVFSRLVPDRPFEYSFLDDEIQKAYDGERRQSTIFGYSCLLAVFVALIGLFGLVLHMTQQRTKEIGIRKIFGASSRRVVIMLTSEFILLVLVANAIALPVAYHFLNDWLRTYPYRIHWDIGYFLSAVSLSLIMALITVGFQSFKAASANPVDSLRYE